MSDKTLYQRDYFPFLRSFKDAINSLPDPDKLIVYEAITDYAFFQIEPNIESPMAKLCWVLIKPILEKQWNKVNAGSKGGAPIGNTNASKQSSLSLSNKHNSSKKQAEFKQQEHIGERIKEKDNENDKDRGQTAKRFTPPSLEDIQAYCSEMGYSFDPQRFLDFYESKGWMVGKTKMENWKAALRGWNSRQPEFEFKPQQPPSKDARRGTDVSASSGSEYEGNF